MQMQCSEESSITTISQRRDDKSRCVSQILISVRKRRVYHSCYELFILNVVAELNNEKIIKLNLRLRQAITHLTKPIKVVVFRCSLLNQIYENVSAMNIKHN